MFNQRGSFASNFIEYAGLKRFCNICGYRFNKFSLFGVRPRECECPICGSLERHRHLYIHLCSIYPFLTGRSVLHFAPEKIIKKILIESEAEYFDVDISPGAATFVEDITNLSFGGDRFDYIICNHVMEHIPDDLKAMRELYRVLKKDGTVFLSVPLGVDLIEDLSIVDPIERTRLFGQSDHVRLYNLDVFVERLSSVGFNCSMLSMPHKFPAPLRDSKLGDTIVLARK